MEIRDYISIGGLIIIVFGWFFSKYKDQQNEKFKSRIARRERLLESFLKVQTMIRETQGRVHEREPEYTRAWLELASLMKLYGTQEENKGLENFADAFLGTKKNIELANQTLNTLSETMISSVRKDLGFRKNTTTDHRTRPVHT